MANRSAVSTEPVSGGFSLPAVAERVSAAAATVRAAAISAGLGSWELQLPRAPVDQASLNCCVSCALGAAMEIIHPGSPSLAPLFNYYVTRFERGAADAAGNLDLAIALIMLTTRGICRGDLHPAAFDEPGSRRRPSEVAFADGRTRALRMRGIEARFQKVRGASRSVWAREQLRQGRPVVIGLVLPNTYSPTRTGRFEWFDPATPPSPNAHCVLATGYNDAIQALHIRDSRGDKPFEQGYWWLGYRVADAAPIKSMYCIVP